MAFYMVGDITEVQVRVAPIQAAKPLCMLVWFQPVTSAVRLAARLQWVRKAVGCQGP